MNTYEESLYEEQTIMEEFGVHSMLAVLLIMKQHIDRLEAKFRELEQDEMSLKCRMNYCRKCPK